MERSDQAVNIFNRGYNCAQSVVMAHADLLDMKEDQLKSYPAGFGAGMGKVQTVCGAVSGAVMVIGGVIYDDDNRAASKEKIYETVNEFIKYFRERFCSLECIDLTGMDISTPEGVRKASEAGVFSDKCENYIREACRLLEEIL